MDDCNAAIGSAMALGLPEEQNSILQTAQAACSSSAANSWRPITLAAAAAFPGRRHRSGGRVAAWPEAYADALKGAWPP